MRLRGAAARRDRQQDPGDHRSFNRQLRMCIGGLGERVRLAAAQPGDDAYRGVRVVVDDH